MFAISKTKIKYNKCNKQNNIMLFRNKLPKRCRDKLQTAGYHRNQVVRSIIYIFFTKCDEKNDEKKENIYSNIDDMLNRSLKSEEE